MGQGAKERQNKTTHDMSYFDGSVQDCCDSSASAMELIQPHTKPWIFPIVRTDYE